MENKKFKGWGVLVAAFLMALLPTGLMNNCFALFMNPVCSDLGFSTTAWSMVNLIGSFASAIGAMVIAGLYQKKNMKVMMIILAVCTGLCWVVATFCTQIWQFYIVFGLNNIFLAGLTQLPISMLVTAWFEDKRATMMSVAFCGGGAGGAIWAPILTKFISASADGWKGAMLFAAIITTVVVVLAALFLVKRSPAEYGTEPYRVAGGEKKADAAPAAPAWIGVSKKVATKSKAWRNVLGVVICIGLLSAGVTTHVPNSISATAQDGGVLAGTVLSVYSIISIVAMLGGGVLMDKIGIKKTVGLCVILIAIGLVSLTAFTVTHIKALAFGYSVFFALAMCLPRLLPAVLMSKVFGTKEYGGIYAFANLFFLIGAAVGSVITAIISGIVGYSITWIIYIAVAVLFFVFVVGALKGGEELQAKYPEGDE